MKNWGVLKLSTGHVCCNGFPSHSAVSEHVWGIFDSFKNANCWKKSSWLFQWNSLSDKLHKYGFSVLYYLNFHLRKSKPVAALLVCDWLCDIEVVIIDDPDQNVIYL